MPNLKQIDQLLTCKPFRDQMCEVYTGENKLITEDLIKFYKLKRITAKYIDKSRDFTDNSYSKKMIRQEEQIFILNCLLFEPFIHNIELQLEITNHIQFEERYQNDKTDIELYLQLLSADFQTAPMSDIHNMLLSKSDMYRMDIITNLLQIKKVREQLVEQALVDSPQLIELLVEKYNLKWVNDKYLAHVKPHNDTQYARLKMAGEESFLIKKLLIFTNWTLSTNQNTQSFEDIKQRLVKLGVDEEKFKQFIAYMNDKYFTMYIENTLPMNQVNTQIKV